ncbi:MAG TPA: glutamate 5-kinase [Prolixibacteraceae bacterium]|nr:glutamate 5-kinase [Prolixibacteraceae bacterium]HCR90826.1 glutamate 5-kinase [Prolixibacteraceae bacterium]HCU62682.1 glutamate 5-kinase [Prolixibacteraceae bacterium]
MNNYRYKKITVKVGSNVLTKSDGTLNDENMAHLVDQIARLHKAGVEVVLVSSGAVAAGRSLIEPHKKLDTVSSRQLWSAVGQVKLINHYAGYFQKYTITCAQVLTTKENFSSRVHYLNMKNCISTLNENGVIPIVNENDTISVTELMFTDNDELSGLIASLVNSEALIILSNIDGIYNGSPDLPESKVIAEIPVGTRLESSIISTQKSNFGRGGMMTKYNIASKVAKEGITVHIANGMKKNVLLDLMDTSKTVVNTRFVPKSKKASDVKKWIAYSESFAKGEVKINEGATKALLSDKATSLLLIGVVEITGSFKKGDIVRIKNENNELIGIGKSQYSSEKATKVLGSKNQQALVHYDYLYLID